MKPGAIAELQRHGLSYVEAQAWLAEHGDDVEAAEQSDRVEAVRAVCKAQGRQRWREE